MNNFSQNIKIFFRWWFATFAVYLAVILLVGWHYGFDFFMPVNDDSIAFMQTAKNLLHFGVFSMDGVAPVAEPQAPLHPTNFVTPGYVFWLAFIYAIFKYFVPAIFLGALFFALSVPLTYFLSKEITADKKTAFWASAIFMIEPLSLYHAGLLFSEQLFVPVFLAACLEFLRYLNYGRKKELFVSLLLFSIATLVRPIIFYFLPLLILFVILKNFWISKKILLIYALLSIFTVYSLVGVWLIRNKIVIGTFQISSNQGHTLGYHYDVLRSYLTRNRGFDPGPLNIPVAPLYGNQEYDILMGKEAAKMLWKYKWDYLKIHLGYMPLFFAGSGYDGLAGRMLDKPILNGTFRNNLALNLINGKILESLKIIITAPAAIYIFLAGALIWGLIAILALIGFAISWRGKSGSAKLILVFVATLLIYFAFITSPLITARYRLPINPFILALAVGGVLYIKQKIKNV